MLRMAGFLLSLCVYVSVLLTKYLKNYRTDRLHFWWMPSLWHKEEMIRFWKKSPRGKGGPGGGGGQNLALMLGENFLSGYNS